MMPVPQLADRQIQDTLAPRQLSTGAEVSGQFGPTKPVPKCLGFKLSWVWSVWFPCN